MNILKKYIFINFRKQTAIVLFITFIGLIFTSVQPFIFKKMINELALQYKSVIFIKLLLIYTVLNYLIAVLDNFKEFYFTKYTFYASFNILLDVYRRILTYPYDKICSMSQGEIYKLLQDTNKFQQIIVNGLIKGFTVVVSLIISFIILYKLYGSYTLIVLVSLPLYYFLVKKSLRKIYNSSLLKEKAQKAWMKEALPPLRQIKGIKKSRIHKIIEQKVQLAIKNLEKISLLHQFGIVKHNYLFHYSKISISTILLVTCSFFIFKHKLTLGDYMAITMVVNTIFDSFNSLSKIIINDIINNIPHYKNLERFLSVSTAIPQNYLSTVSKIRIDNIFFKHNDSNFELSSKVITLGKNGIYYLVGKNGAGKSTLLDIIADLLKPEKGSIKYDKIDINSVSEEWKKNNISFVMQEPLILSGTIFDNIVLDANMNKNELREKADLYDLFPFYEVLEDRFDESLENENALSGGEKQIIQILRLLVRDSSIILIDEGDSNLDFRLKEIFRNSILKMSKEKLILAITHDFSQLSISDNILIINAGKILLKKMSVESIKKYLEEVKDEEIKI